MNLLYSPLSAVPFVFERMNMNAGWMALITSESAETHNIMRSHASMRYASSELYSLRPSQAAPLACSYYGR